MNFLFPFTNSQAQPQLPTVVDVAVADGRFKTLVSALKETDLVSTLQGQGPFTVFAPTDNAFAMLNLAGVSREALKNVLLYHVVAGYFPSSELKSVLQLKSVQGSPINVRFENGKVYINNSQVVIADIKTRNGVIHVIDTVLQLPVNTVQYSPRRNMY
jgi:transforming growth factor-beta-induced protein